MNDKMGTSFFFIGSLGINRPLFCFSAFGGWNSIAYNVWRIKEVQPSKHYNSNLLFKPRQALPYNFNFLSLNRACFISWIQVLSATTDTSKIYLIRCFKSKTFSWSVIQFFNSAYNLFICYGSKVSVFRKILSD